MKKTVTLYNQRMFYRDAKIGLRLYTVCTATLKSLWDLSDNPKQLDIILSDKPFQDSYKVTVEHEHYGVLFIHLSNGATLRSPLAFTGDAMAHLIEGHNPFYVGVQA